MKKRIIAALAVVLTIIGIVVLTPKPAQAEGSVGRQCFSGGLTCNFNVYTYNENNGTGYAQFKTQFIEEGRRFFISGDMKWLCPGTDGYRTRVDMVAYNASNQHGTRKRQSANVCDGGETAFQATLNPEGTSLIRVVEITVREYKITSVGEATRDAISFTIDNPYHGG